MSLCCDRNMNDVISTGKCLVKTRGVAECFLVFTRSSGVTRTYQKGGLLGALSKMVGGQHQEQILGSAFQALKYVILHTVIVEMSNFIEVDDYIHNKLGWPLGWPSKFIGDWRPPGYPGSYANFEKKQ